MSNTKHISLDLTQAELNELYLFLVHSLDEHFNANNSDFDSVLVKSIMALKPNTEQSFIDMADRETDIHQHLDAIQKQVLAD